MLARVKKNDTVVVLSGSDKGKQGTVLAVYPQDGAVLVKDVSVVTRHVKPTRQGQKGGIVKQERPVPLAKVMPVCAACKKACRIQAKTLETGKKVRICNRCKETF
ncbi:50S ribosomal protein L24 [bacterium]|nr:50S ribosomal protein L24 [bacterium]